MEAGTGRHAAGRSTRRLAPAVYHCISTAGASVRDHESAAQGEGDGGAATAQARAFCASAAALQAQRQFRHARDAYQQALDLIPDCVAALVGQGECNIELGAYEDARDCFELALAHNPLSVPALSGNGRLLRTAGDLAGAVECLRQGLRQQPDNADLLFELGLALNRTEDTVAAIDAYERTLAADPRHHGALVNLGLVHLTQLADAQRAQHYFETAAQAYPQSVAAQANLGLALQEQGQWDAALAHYEALIAQDPQAIEYRWNRGLAHLYRNDFARGWPDYEWRHRRGGRDVRRDFGLPVWDGADAARHHVLVYSEQGVGDEVMFAGCLPDLLARAGGVVLECDSRLAALIARSFPQLVVHGGPRDGSRDWLRRYPALDCQIAIGSLPLHLRRSSADFPRHRGYLVADPARVEAWRQRFRESGVLPTIGFAWRGGTRKTRAGLRSLELGACLPLAQARAAHFICLQRGDCAEELAAARRAGFDLQWWPEALDDIEETAALIAALDLVVSVDNTVVHLAGAIGRPCWTMLAHMPDWRYGSAGDAMPWYPSLRLFRQARAGDWRNVVDAVAAAIATQAFK